jgi:hypothetical protein
MVASRQATMSNFNSFLEMDDVHTPARYIALFSILRQGVVCFSFMYLRSKSCIMFFSFAHGKCLGPMIPRSLDWPNPGLSHSRSGPWIEPLWMPELPWTLHDADTALRLSKSGQVRLVNTADTQMDTKKNLKKNERLLSTTTNGEYRPESRSDSSNLAKDLPHGITGILAMDARMRKTVQCPAMPADTYKS